MQDALSHLQWALTLLLQQGEGEGVREGEGAREGEEERGEGEGVKERGEREEERRKGEVTRPVHVLEKAACVHVMMAQLQGRGSQDHRESCLAALAYCCLIWKVGCVLYIDIVHTLTENNNLFVLAQGTVESYAQLLSGKCDVQLPTSVQGWTDFKLTDEVLCK